MRALTYYVGMSLDPTPVREQLGLTAPGTRFDTVVMGRNTYTPALEAGIRSPYAHLDQYVVSATLPASPDPQPHVVAGDPVGLVRRLKHQPGAGVWLAGGGRLAGSLLGEIDELVIKRYPVVLGSGIPVSATDRSHLLSFEFVDNLTLRGGTTVTTYTRRGSVASG